MSVLPRTGSATVRFMLHRWAWQHSTIWSGDGGVLQVILPCSYFLKQPFWDTGVPSLRVREEKHCCPIQRSPVTHERPSHTHSYSVGTIFNFSSGTKKHKCVFVNLASGTRYIIYDYMISKAFNSNRSFLPLSLNHCFGTVKGKWCHFVFGMAFFLQIES